MVGLRHGLRLLKPAHKPAQRIPVLGRAASLLLGSADFGDVDVRRHQHLLRLDAEKQRVLADCLLPELRAGAEVKDCDGSIKFLRREIWRKYFPYS